MKKPISQVTGSEKLNKKERKKRFRRHIMKVLKVMVFTSMLSAPVGAADPKAVKEISKSAAHIVLSSTLKKNLRQIVRTANVGFLCMLPSIAPYGCVFGTLIYIILSCIDD